MDLKDPSFKQKPFDNSLETTRLVPRYDPKSFLQPSDSVELSTTRLGTALSNLSNEHLRLKALMNPQSKSKSVSNPSNNQEIYQTINSAMHQIQQICTNLYSSPLNSSFGHKYQANDFQPLHQFEFVSKNNDVRPSEFIFNVELI